MSTPAIHESTAHAEAEDYVAPDPKVWRNRVIGLVLGVVVAVIVYFIFPSNAAELAQAAYKGKEEMEFTQTGIRAAAAVACLMGIWWMTEAIPLAATALVPLVAFPLMQVVKFKDAASPYAQGTIFLFMGGFMLALAMQRWNLHRRIALRTVLLVGTKPRRLVLGFMLATGFMSMWVSNTATAVMMLPIGLSVLTLIEQLKLGKQAKFATALMLGIAYAASIGSLGTIIGTPPNTLIVAYLAENHDIKIGFGQWMIMGVPLAVIFLVIAWLLLTRVLYKPEMEEIPGGRELIQDELNKMGKMSRGEKLVGMVFLAAAFSWVAIPLILEYSGSKLQVPDEGIAMVAALLLFLIPVDAKHGVRLLDWATAKELPWDVLLLFGGGLSLSKMFTDLGLSLWIGETAKALGTLPVIVVIIAVTTLIIFLTELTSNTATAAAFIPIMGGVALGIGLTDNGAVPQNVMLLTVPVALAATCAFMLPVATPPNAIAYGSGYIKMSQMIKAGIWLNIIGIVLITLTMIALAIPVFGLSL